MPLNYFLWIGKAELLLHRDGLIFIGNKIVASGKVEMLINTTTTDIAILLGIEFCIIFYRMF